MSYDRLKFLFYSFLFLSMDVSSQLHSQPVLSPWNQPSFCWLTGWVGQNVFQTCGNKHQFAGGSDPSLVIILAKLNVVYVSVCAFRVILERKIAIIKYGLADVSKPAFLIAGSFSGFWRKSWRRPPVWELPVNMLSKHSDTADSRVCSSLTGLILLNCDSKYTLLRNANFEVFTGV